MTLSNPKPWLLQAQREHFAMGAFNANTMEQIQAIVLAAQEERAPVIIQISHRALQYIGSGSTILGLQYVAEVGKVAAQSVTVPVTLHLDHANEIEVLQAIGLGFTSVMFDGGDLPFEQNIVTTKKLREIAHAAGVCIEAELGEVPHADSAGKLDHENVLTNPDDAAIFVKATGIDSLAIAIGSVHSVKQKQVALNLDRLKAIRQVVDVPLVLHGSSGVIDADISQGIALGLCKINVATQFNQAFTRAVRAKLAEDAAEVDPRKYLAPARDAMKAQVCERIHFLGLAGKAGRE
jgi:fructose-bisphosphate aldolase, class II